MATGCLSARSILDRFHQSRKRQASLSGLGRMLPRWLEPVGLSTKMYEDDTWIPLVHEIREKGEELNIS